MRHPLVRQGFDELDRGNISKDGLYSMFEYFKKEGIIFDIEYRDAIEGLKLVEDLDD